MELLKLEDYQNLEAKKVIDYFAEINKIPRRSGEEKQIREYLEEFAKNRNLEYVKDEYENIIIYKKASKGRETEESLTFQAHTDMICEKDIGIQHDFSKDPIILYKEGDYITAKGTTLGADNGIGVAYMLAILDSDISIPNLECVFTVQEETTMIGAIKIDAKNIRARKIISLDSANEKKILISSANCNEWIGIMKAEKEMVNEKNEIYRLTYENFLGGHSGGNIGDEKRGNPIKLAMEALENASNIQIIKLKGGSRVNVIPREFMIEFCVLDKEDKTNKVTNNSELGGKNKIKNIEANSEEVIQKIQAKIQKQKEKFQNETIVLEKLEENKQNQQNQEIIKAYSKNKSREIIDFVNEYKNGALKREENQNVILSANLAVLTECKNGMQIEFSERSNKKELEKEYLQELQQLITKYDINITWHQELKGVEKKENNKLLEKCQKAYLQIFDKKMEEVITQSVVEGGFFADKMPDCEYVCIGPNIYDLHSPKERVSICSIDRMWKVIKEILK